MGTVSSQSYEPVLPERHHNAIVSTGQKRRILLVYDTFELKWDLCNIYRSCTDPDWGHHKIFLREKKSLRLLGRTVAHKLGDAFTFPEYTLEEDLRLDTTPTPHDLLILLQHDWPTVNENPTWLLKFTSFLQTSPKVVPSPKLVRKNVLR